MGTPYPNTTASGYNSSPPADDGSVTASNKVKYATIKTQLGDPVKGEADAINTALRAALNVTPTTQSTAYTTTTADHLRPIEVTGTTTISLGDAATMVAASMGYAVPIVNTGTATVTVDLHTATDTLDGVVNGTLSLLPGQAITAAVNSTNNGYDVISDRGFSKALQQNSQSAAYTTVLSDAGKHILHPTADNSARTFTIDSNANVAYPVGTMITFVNQINTVTIAITSDTLTLAGAGSTGSRTLAANGIATALKVGSTSWVISGTGLT